MLLLQRTINQALAPPQVLARLLPTTEETPGALASGARTLA
jgi:hypothetical protein